MEKNLKGRNRTNTAMGNHEEYNIMKIWSAASNELVNLDLTPKALGGFKPVGQFKADYLKLCELVKIVPHPSITPRKRHNTEDSRQEESPSPGYLSSSSKRRDPKQSVSRASIPNIASLLEEVFNMTETPLLKVRNTQVDMPTLQLVIYLVTQPDLCNLTTLDFYNAGLSFAQISMLAEALPTTRLQKLSIDYSPVQESVDSKGQTIFAAIIGEDSPIRAASLRGNQITDRGAVAIANAISKNTRCVTVNLFDNEITDIGGTAIVDSLKINTTVNSISLSNNRLGPATLVAFGELLTRYELTPAVAEARAEAVNRINLFNKHVAEIRKKQKDQTLPGPQPLPELPEVEQVEGTTYVKGRPNLFVVNLGANHFDDESAQGLFRMMIPHKVQLLSSFKAMSLAGNKLSPNIKSMFQEFQPIQFLF